jgi:hypothetical protein
VTLVKAFERVESLWEYLQRRAWGRLLIVATFPVWSFLALLVCSIGLIAEAAWEGDPGKLLRWLWRGPDSAKDQPSDSSKEAK